MAGFQLTLHGRIWVTPEGRRHRRRMRDWNTPSESVKRLVSEWFDSRS